MIDSQGGRQENQGTTLESVAEHPAWHRLEDQLQWYDTKSTRCQRWYKRLKLVQIRSRGHGARATYQQATPRAPGLSLPAAGLGD
jgi:hypothetical protein